jgi:hypothetical protein
VWGVNESTGGEVKENSREQWPLKSLFFKGRLNGRKDMGLSGGGAICCLHLQGRRVTLLSMPYLGVFRQTMKYI